MLLSPKLSYYLVLCVTQTHTSFLGEGHGPCTHASLVTLGCYCIPFSVPMASQHWLSHVPSHSLALHSGALAPLPTSACLWESFFICVSLKHIHLPALLPSYDPTLAPSSLSSHCDLKLVLCHHPHPVPRPGHFTRSHAWSPDLHEV